MRFPSLLAGRFLRRDNRFRVTVEVKGTPVAAYLPNSGRLRELLTPGRPCYLRRRDDNPARKTAFDLVLVEHAGVPVSVNSHLPNALFAESLAGGWLGPFRGWAVLRREVTLGHSRLDFLLTGEKEANCWVEVKSVTLVEGSTALFPDAPTARGRRHIRELTAAVRRGERAALTFIVQRPDAVQFAPNARADDSFAATLQEAARVGVEVYAWRCAVSHREIVITDRIPVVLSLPSVAHRTGTPTPRGG